MTEDVVAVFIPIVFFLVIGFVLALRLYFRHRSEQAYLSTVRASIDRGDALTPELLAALAPAPVERGDLRRGLLSVMAALATAAFGLLIGEPDARMPLLGLACFPLFIGVAYLLLWRLHRGRTSQDAPR